MLEERHRIRATHFNLSHLKPVAFLAVNISLSVDDSSLQCRCTTKVLLFHLVDDEWFGTTSWFGNYIVPMFRDIYLGMIFQSLLMSPKSESSGKNECPLSRNLCVMVVNGTHQLQQWQAHLNSSVLTTAAVWPHHKLSEWVEFNAPLDTI